MFCLTHPHLSPAKDPSLSHGAAQRLLCLPISPSAVFNRPLRRPRRGFSPGSRVSSRALAPLSPPRRKANPLPPQSKGNAKSRAETIVVAGVAAVVEASAEANLGRPPPSHVNRQKAGSHAAARADSRKEDLNAPSKDKGAMAHRDEKSERLGRHAKDAVVAIATTGRNEATASQRTRLR